MWASVNRKEGSEKEFLSTCFRLCYETRVMNYHFLLLTTAGTTIERLLVHCKSISRTINYNWSFPRHLWKLLTSYWVEFERRIRTHDRSKAPDPRSTFSSCKLAAFCSTHPLSGWNSTTISFSLSLTLPHAWLLFLSLSPYLTLAREHTHTHTLFLSYFFTARLSPLVVLRA